MTLVLVLGACGALCFLHSVPTTHKNLARPRKLRAARVMFFEFKCVFLCTSSLKLKPRNSKLSRAHESRES